MTHESSRFDVVTLTLNPAIDRTLTIAHFTAGAVNRVGQQTGHPGGKGVNVASALADCGHPVAATGFLGRENSRSFEALFARKNIADRFVRIEGRTRVGIKIVDPARSETTDINFPGAEPAPAAIAALHKVVETLDAPWFVLAGSLPPGVDSAFYRDAVASLKARGCKVLVDASGDPLRKAIKAAPTVIKPNLHELEMLLGHSFQDKKATPAIPAILDAARALVARGIELVVVSMGREGACFVTADDAIIARPPEVEVQSTVGAGDAMVAGILSAQLRHLPLADCARLATAFSLDALTRLESGLSERAAIQAAMERVTLAKDWPPSN